MMVMVIIIIGQDGNPLEYPVNQWYGLGREYGYTDHFTEYTDVNTEGLQLKIGFGKMLMETK